MNELAMKLVGLALILSVFVFGGCRWQARLDAGKIEKAQGAAETLRGSLRAASAALSASAARFLAIDAQTRTNAEAAARAKQAAEGQAKAARKDATAFQRQVLELERQAERDRATCSIAEAQICGSRLY